MLLWTLRFVIVLTMNSQCVDKRIILKVSNGHWMINRVYIIHNLWKFAKSSIWIHREEKIMMIESSKTTDIWFNWILRAPGQSVEYEKTKKFVFYSVLVGTNSCWICPSNHSIILIYFGTFCMHRGVVRFHQRCAYFILTCSSSFERLRFKSSLKFSIRVSLLFLRDNKSINFK